MRARTRPVLVALALAAAGCGGAVAGPCGGATSCPSGSTCSVGSCRPDGAPIVAVDSHRVVVPAAELSVLTSRGTSPPPYELIALGRGAWGETVVLLRFDGVPRAEVVGAFVVFDPMQGVLWPRRVVDVELATVLEPWSAEGTSWGTQPRLDVPTLAARIGPSAPVPLRIDVTRVVQRWAERPSEDHGLALVARGDDPTGAVYTTGLSGEGGPPRLEVYFR